jgi:hypothetical protein
LSRFLFSCLPAGRCSCTKDKFVMSGASGLAHLHAIKFLHLDKFLAPRQLVPRHCAGTRLPAYSNRDSFSVTYQNCTTIAPTFNLLCTMTAKTRAIPSLPAGRQACTVIVYRLKYQDPTRCLRRITRPLLNLASRYPDIICRDFTLGPLYCRSVSTNISACDDYAIAPY